jgi:hypothetical protein
LSNNRNVADAYNYARKNGKNKKHSFHFSQAPSMNSFREYFFTIRFRFLFRSWQNKKPIKSGSKDK